VERRIFLLVLGLGLLVGAAIATAVVVIADDDEPDFVERPAAEASVEGKPRTIELEGDQQLPPVSRREQRREVTPETTRLTPVSPADPIESSDFAATDLQDPNDPRGTGDAYGLFSNSLVDRGSGIYIAEPNVAAKGDRMLVVWNFGAAFSGDGGKTFNYVNPRTKFPSASAGYCCDQVALYVPAKDMWVWFIQYRPDETERNVVRIAVAKGDEAFDQQRFTYYDFTSADFPSLKGLAARELDFPNLAASDEHLFLSLNVFKERYATTVLMRVPLDELAEGKVSSVRSFASALGGIDFTAGATDTMYFAEHVDTSTLRVSRWADNSDDPESIEVAHSSYPRPLRGFPYTCGRIGAAIGDWCRRSDDRLGTGWIADGTLGFAWNSPQDKSRGFPFPFVMVVRIDLDTMTVKDEPILWSSKHAYSYSAFAPNDRGEIGGIVLAGGGERYQTCTTLLSDLESGGGWDARAAVAGDHDPIQNEAGDYLGMAPAGPGSNLWTTACMALRGGSGYRDVEIRVLKFGRVKDAGD
jgi:hypothetical protein